MRYRRGTQSSITIKEFIDYCYNVQNIIELISVAQAEGKIKIANEKLLQKIGSITSVLLEKVTKSSVLISVTDFYPTVDEEFEEGGDE